MGVGESAVWGALPRKETSHGAEAFALGLSEGDYRGVETIHTNSKESGPQRTADQINNAPRLGCNRTGLFRRVLFAGFWSGRLSSLPRDALLLFQDSKDFDAGHYFFRVGHQSDIGPQFQFADPDSSAGVG